MPKPTQVHAEDTKEKTSEAQYFLDSHANVISILLGKGVEQNNSGPNCVDLIVSNPRDFSMQNIQV
jgi:hypothetical protein